MFTSQINLEQTTTVEIMYYLRRLRPGYTDIEISLGTVMWKLVMQEATSEGAWYTQRHEFPLVNSDFYPVSNDTIDRKL